MRTAHILARSTHHTTNLEWQLLLQSPSFAVLNLQKWNHHCDSGTTNHVQFLTKYLNNLREQHFISPRRGSKPPLLSAIENTMSPSLRSSLLFASPVRMEEDVLVMDEISVDAIPGSRPKLLMSSDSCNWSSGYNLHKTEICRAWEDFSCCRYKNKCQLAHGKEELCPSRITNKNKQEHAQTSISHGKTESSTAQKSRFFRIAAGVEAATVSTEAHTNIGHATTGATSSFTSQMSNEWLPQDDGIEAVLPFSFTEWDANMKETKGNIDVFISSILYGSSKKRTRLPLFDDICSG